MDISRHSGLIFSKRMLGFSIDFQLLMYHHFSISQHLSLVCLTVGLKNIKILRESARKGNARKPKVRKFLYIFEYYCDYDFTYYFLGNCSTKRSLLQKIRASVHILTCAKTLIRWWRWGVKKTKRHWWKFLNIGVQTSDVQYIRQSYNLAVAELLLFFFWRWISDLTSSPLITRCISEYFSAISM